MGSDCKSNDGCGGDATGVGGCGGNVQIPVAAKKVVQNVKEAINGNCSDSEIYAVLRGCDMDPNDAVQRLLSQDTFHEVKSKRERRKEMKETQEFKTRATNNTSNRGVRVGNELGGGGRSGWAQIGSNELGKAAYGKENGCYVPSASHATGKVLSEQHSTQRRQSVETVDIVYSSVQPSTGFQSSWVGASSEQVSMADIVRMGKSVKDSQHLSETSEILHLGVQPSSAPYYPSNSPSSSSSQSEMHQHFHSQNLDAIHQSNNESVQPGLGNNWPVTEHITANRGSSIVDASTAKSAVGAEMYSNQSYSDRSNLSSNYQSDEIRLLEGDAMRDNLTKSTQSSSQQIMMTGGNARSSRMLLQNHSASSSNDIIRTVSSTIMNLQQLSLQKKPTKAVSEEGHGVVLPNYLQAFAADCSHLSFGTYKSGKSTLTRPLTSSPLTSGLEASAAADGPSALHLDSRNPVYQGEKQLGFTLDTHGAIVDSRNNDSAKSTERELERQDIPEGGNHQEDITLSSVVARGFESIQQLSSAMPFVINPNARNVPLLSEMALNSGTSTVPQPSSHVLPGATLATEPAFLRPLPMHSYSQNGYSSMLQSNLCAPSTLQQACLDGNMFHESLLAAKYNFPNHQIGAASNNLRFSSSYPPGYQGCGNSNDATGSFLQNLTPAHPGHPVHYDDILRTQLKDNFNMLHLNDLSGRWNYGHDSRNLSSVPDAACYSLLGQNQQITKYHQGQQPPIQQYGASGFSSIHDYHRGIMQQPQQQSLSDLIPASSQDSSSKQLPQIWQHRY